MNVNAPLRAALASLTSFVSLLTLVAGCSAPADDAGADGEDTSGDSEELSTVALGVDTNNSTIDTNHLHGAGFSFVGRYLSFDGSHPILTPEEAGRLHGATVPIVSIWEVTKYRVVEGGAVATEHAYGVADAQKAKAVMDAASGGADKPIYFTVDFDVTDAYWTSAIKDRKTGQRVQRSQLILAYFEGVKSVLGQHRTGVYGTYTTLKNLFDQHLVAYGWQQTFGDRGAKVDHRAQLRQYDITPDTTGWNVSGAGALDYDRAVKVDYGAW